MPKQRWTPLPALSWGLTVPPGPPKPNRRLPAQAPQTADEMLLDNGRGRVRYTNQKNEFPHPPRPGRVADEIVEKRMSLEENVNLVKMKIKDAVADEETPIKLLRKMGNDKLFLENVVHAMRFDELE